MVDAFSAWDRERVKVELYEVGGRKQGQSEHEWSEGGGGGDDRAG